MKNETNEEEKIPATSTGSYSVTEETDYQKWLWWKIGEKTVKQLKKHGFDAHLVPSTSDAADLIMPMTVNFDSFGFGGSETTRQLGVMNQLKKNGKTIYDHWKAGLTPEQDMAIRLNQGQCDCFFASANAVSATGEVINVDGIGNRTNAMCFGPKKVIITAGMNKVTQDLACALDRIKQVAGPMRAKSLGMKTPCAETGICSDCESPQRICRITTILHRKPMKTDITVILINESLGF